MDETIEQYIQKLINNGYITINGAPLKCLHCDSKDLAEKHTYENHYIIEIEVTCNSCDKPTGLWSYGNWDI